MTFILPAETQDRLVTITIPAEVDAYFKEWYLETKKDGETPEQFAYRNLAKAGLAYRKQKASQADADAFKALIDKITIDHDTLVLDSGLE